MDTSHRRASASDAENITNFAAPLGAPLIETQNKQSASSPFIYHSIFLSKLKQRVNNETAMARNLFRIAATHAKSFSSFHNLIAASDSLPPSRSPLLTAIAAA